MSLWDRNGRPQTRQGNAFEYETESLSYCVSPLVAKVSFYEICSKNSKNLFREEEGRVNDCILFDLNKTLLSLLEFLPHSYSSSMNYAFSWGLRERCDKIKYVTTRAHFISVLKINETRISSIVPIFMA